ncbi:hypothetical protein Tasa_009_142 [Tanticharoenia sakaeratensis NBRC 103193]|uniref:Uncharacterized protein n=1 Tax=Tanticharoenia sakaeratensis NBRC 103193 TaxID=1231623 RepID=A0A0D6MIA9_9PROT|nr:hypothetical protein Tasa_009_142 [Tanticharoenia sakaeratensis NBRC 103193]GBQ20910.1 hypothetical protein AA103193_1546 [Tanticharoenia sakaeratensis NBRC 103193]
MKDVNKAVEPALRRRTILIGHGAHKRGTEALCPYPACGREAITGHAERMMSPAPGVRRKG